MKERMSKLEERATPRTVGQLLADLPPKGWPDVVRKFAVLQTYASLEKPTLGDARAAAARLGLRERGFYHLVRVYEASGSPKDIRGKRGAPRQGDPRVDDIIVQVAAELGPAATGVAILKEVTSRCAREGLIPPSASMLLTRLDDPPKKPDVRRALGISVDLVLDVAPVPIPLLTEKGPTPSAHLGAFVDTGDGRIVAWLLTASQFADDDVSMLVDALPRPTEPFALRTSVGLPPLSIERRVDLLGRGIAVFDDGPPIRVGAALRAACGRYLGRIRILEAAPPPGRSTGDGVSLEIAREVVGLLIARRNDAIGTG